MVCFIGICQSVRLMLKLKLKYKKQPLSWTNWASILRVRFYYLKELALYFGKSSTKYYAIILTPYQITLSKRLVLIFFKWCSNINLFIVWWFIKWLYHEPLLECHICQRVFLDLRLRSWFAKVYKSYLTVLKVLVFFCWKLDI